MKAVLALFAGVCLLASDRVFEAPEAVLARVPQKARAKRNPLKNDEQAAGKSASLGGKKLFEQHCAECHGEQAEGTRRAPGLRDALNRATDGEIFWILSNGVVRRGMPAWDKLPEEQRWQIVSYLLSGRSLNAQAP